MLGSEAILADHSVCLFNANLDHNIPCLAHMSQRCMTLFRCSLLDSLYFRGINTIVRDLRLVITQTVNMVTYSSILFLVAMLSGDAEATQIPG